MRQLPTITLIGMSGSGKTYWSKKLAPLGYVHYSCDQFIAIRLSYLLQVDPLSLSDLAEWMGKPYEPDYEYKQQQYLAWESQSVIEAYHKLMETDHAWVIDATGSFIYLPEDIQMLLTENTHVVVLDTPEEYLEEMYRVFLSDPKPIVWGEHYQPKPGETPEQALKRCYPELLRWRRERYLKTGHQVMPFEFHRPKETTPELFHQAVVDFIQQQA